MKTALHLITAKGAAIAACGILTLALAMTPVSDAAAKNNNGKGKPEKEGVSGPGNKGGQGNQGGQSGDADIEDAIVDSVIDASARALMGDYFRANPQPVDSLPPGIAKKLQRGKPLPPGIAKRNLPTDLSGQLKQRDASIGDVVDAVIVGDDVAIVDAASGVVVEILKDIVRAQ